MKGELLHRLPEILFRIGKVIGSDDSLASTLSTISELVTELTEAEACSILLVDPEQKALFGKAAYGLLRDDISAVSFRLGEGVAGWVADHKESVLLDDATRDPRFKFLGDETHIRSLACVPLMSRNEAIGVLTITSPEAAKFSQSSVDLLLLVGSTIALDIENIRLRRLAVTDSLTGAYNREFLDKELDLALEEAGRSGESISIAMIDADHFKDINDTYGHHVGDIVLKELTNSMRSTVRARDLVVRYGGEEFLLLLPRTEIMTAKDIAERTREQIAAAPIRADGHEIQLQVSIGVAQFRNGESSASLVRRADQALYRAKELGRNRVELAA